jgi:hypothetical protein
MMSTNAGAEDSRFLDLSDAGGGTQRLFRHTGHPIIHLLVVLLLTGCATMKVVSTDQLNEQRFVETATPVAHIYVDNWGIYLFKYIPLVTGNVDKAGQPQIFRLFTNNVRVDLLVDKVTQESRRRGGTVITDLRTRDRSYWIPWTLIFWLNEFEVSGNSSRNLPPSPSSP